MSTSSWLVLTLTTMLAGCATDAGSSGSGSGSGCDDGKCDNGNSTGSGGSGASVVAQLRADLQANLMAQMDSPSQSFLFGQQRFNLTGVNNDGTEWNAAPGDIDRSDVKTITGQHPAVLGFDAFELVKPDTWLPSPQTNADAAKLVHSHGGVVTMTWHMYGCTKTDSFLAEGNESCLCKVANDDGFARSWLLDGSYKRFADALVAGGLDQIPIIFRPLHEHNGAWFWWGEKFWDCSSYVSNPRFSGAAAYQRVYQTIVTYLRVERGFNNLLIEYSPAGLDNLATESGYLDGYPGDEYVDVLGADLYYQASPSFYWQTASFKSQLQNITRLARAHGKVAALAEVGNTQLAFDTTPSQSTWFSAELLPLLQSPGIAMAYALTWENRTSGPEQFWVPYGPHPGVPDFKQFAATGVPIMLSSVPALDHPPATGYPACASCASSDTNGDGWGWENNKSCRVGSWCMSPKYPPCKLCASADTNGDGWGWENNKSCVMLATCR